MKKFMDYLKMRSKYRKEKLKVKMLEEDNKTLKAENKYWKNRRNK